MEFGTPAPWLENNFLTATGYDLALEPAIENEVKPETEPEPAAEKIYTPTRRNKTLAKRAAMADAYRKLVEQIGEVRITAEKNFVKHEVDAVVKFAEVIAEEYDEYGNCIITMRIPIYGAKDSVAKAAFKRVDKENFPPPTENIDATGRNKVIAD